MDIMYLDKTQKGKKLDSKIGEYICLVYLGVIRCNAQGLILVFHSQITSDSIQETIWILGIQQRLATCKVSHYTTSLISQEIIFFKMLLTFKFKFL